MGRAHAGRAGLLADSRGKRPIGWPFGGRFLLIEVEELYGRFNAFGENPVWGRVMVFVNWMSHARHMGLDRTVTVK